MVSVIIVNYRSAHIVERAVGSVFSGTGEIEVIIVDNTSSPEEAGKLREISKSYNVTLVLNRENRGFAAASNQAFHRSKGEFVLLLNPDAYVLSSCLDTLTGFLNANPGAGAVSPMVCWDDGMRYLFPHYPYPSPLRDVCGRLARASKTFSSIYSLGERKRNLKLWRSADPVRVKNLHGGVMMIRRSAAERAGGLFDERFFLFYEDTDLCFRLRKKGHSLYVLPGAKAVHNYCHNQEKLDRMAETLKLYNEKHFGRNILTGISRLITGDRPRRCVDCGVWKVPPSLRVPSGLKEEYLFEWSPSPLFIPSIGCFGSGGSFVFSTQVWDFLAPGVYYSRFTDPGKILQKSDILLWRKQA